MPDPESPWSAFGAELRRYRESRGLTLRQFAASIYTAGPVISRWENGHRPVPAEHARRLDDALSAGGHLVALHAAVAEVAELRSRLQENTSAPDEDDMERRVAMQLLAALSVGAVIPPGTIDTIFVGVERATGDRVDLDDWERTVYEYGYLIARRPIGSLINDLTADVIATGHLLGRGHSPLIQAGLLRVSAGLSWMLATEFGATGDQRAARIAWRTARHAADASGDREMAVWVRAKEAGDAWWAGSSPRGVAHLVNEAVQIAQTAPSYGLMRAHTVRAWLAAERGDDGGARAALRDFVQTFERLPEGTPLHNDPAASGLAEAYVRWHEAHVYALIGDDRATATIEQAFALYPPDASGQVALLRLIQAVDLVRQREIDEGLGHALAYSAGRTAPVSTAGRHLAGRVISALPDKARELPAARELRALTAS